MRRIFHAGLPLLALAACAGNGDGVETAGNNAASAQASSERPFNVEVIADFDSPWALAFLPDGSALITEKSGRLVHWTRQNGQNRTVDVAGVPQVDAGGQGGLGDVALHPQFASNHMVYLSFAEAGEGDTRGAAIGRGRLVMDGGSPRIEGWQVIWRQVPKFEGRGHFGHRIAFAPDGHLFISSGERQQFDPAQDMNSNAGKVLRLNDDGSVPADNPFASRGGVTAQIWSLGHRNPLGLAFAPDGRLWENEMGPAGGDELNLIERGSNYGYPIVSNGDHYDGRPIPDHDTRPEFNAPEVTWTPVISPSSLIFYTGGQFRDWRGNILIGGLSSQALVRVAIDGDSAREVARYPMNARIRAVDQGPDGSIYLLEDGGRDSQGRLLRLTPAR